MQSRVESEPVVEPVVVLTATYEIKIAKTATDVYVATCGDAKGVGTAAHFAGAACLEEIARRIRRSP